MSLLPRVANPRFARAYDLIADKLADVEKELLLHFRSPIPTIDGIGNYLADAGGDMPFDAAVVDISAGRAAQPSRAEAPAARSVMRKFAVSGVT